MLCNVQDKFRKIGTLQEPRLVHCSAATDSTGTAAVTAFAKAWSNKIWSTWRFATDVGD